MQEIENLMFPTVAARSAAVARKLMVVGKSPIARQVFAPGVVVLCREHLAVALACLQGQYQ
jgi:hypothetical protein